MNTGFQERLRAKMEENSLSSRQLGGLSGVPKRTIDGWIGARAQTPNVYAAVAVSTVLNTTAEFLVTGLDTRYENLSTIRGKFQRFIDDSPDRRLEALTVLLTAVGEYAHGEGQGKGPLKGGPA